MRPNYLPRHVVAEAVPSVHWSWVPVVLLVLLGLLAWGHAVDEQAEVDSLALQRAYEAGREAARQDMAQSVGSAWAQGVAEGEALGQAQCGAATPVAGARP